MGYKKSLFVRVAPLAVLVGSAGALAQAEPVAEEEEVIEDWSTEGEPSQSGANVPTAQLEAGNTRRVDGPRFRGGVAFTAGVQGLPKHDWSVGMFGVDGRLGVQVNDLVGVYAMPHLSFGSSGSLFASTGTFNALVGTDLTFLDSLFVGAGLGYGVFNNPSGPMLSLRVGGYPVKSVAEDRPRRKGLMLGLETRFTFIGDHNGFNYGTGYQVLASIGYEAF